MKNKLIETVFGIIAVIYCLAGPATFIYLIATIDNWTLWNATPYVLMSLCCASFWWAYWPLHLLFGL